MCIGILELRDSIEQNFRNRQIRVQESNIKDIKRIMLYASKGEMNDLEIELSNAEDSLKGFKEQQHLK